MWEGVMIVFVAGLATGCLLGVAGTVLLLLLSIGFSEDRPVTINNAPFRGLVFAAVALVAAFGLSHVLNLHKSSEVLLLLLTILLIAQLGGVTSGLMASGVAAAILSFFILRPVGSFWIAKPNDRFLLALFLLLAIVGCQLIAMRNRGAFSTERP
jgi:K+-sensing histidine kinase KdpD